MLERKAQKGQGPTSIRGQTRKSCWSSWFPPLSTKSLSSHRRVGVSSACPLDYVQCERSHQPRPPWCVTKCDPGSGVLGSDESDPSKQPHLQAPCQQSLHTQLDTLYLYLSPSSLSLSPLFHAFQQPTSACHPGCQTYTTATDPIPDQKEYGDLEHA